MDYPFFIAKLFECTPEELASLQTIAGVDHPRSTFFITQKQVCSLHHPVEAMPASLLNRLDLLGFEHKNIRKIGSNVIDPGGRIHDHSDIEADRGVAVNRSQAHTIHIPVFNNVGVYRHRRSRKLPWTSTKLVLGGVYMYNNYVSHEVDCQGATCTRTNLLIDYIDEHWVQKYHMLKLLDHGKPGQRYESENLYPDYANTSKLTGAASS